MMTDLVLTTPEDESELLSLLLVALGLADRLGHALAAIHIQNAHDIIALDIESKHKR